MCADWRLIDLHHGIAQFTLTIRPLIYFRSQILLYYLGFWQNIILIGEFSEALNKN